MWPALATIGPRILIPGFFVGQKVSTISDPSEIAQTIAFSFLFVSFAIALFSKTPWISLIPGVAAWAYWSMLHDRDGIENYRYTDWAITTPLMLLALLVVNNVSEIKILGLMIADFIMITAGYVGASWGETTTIMFIIGCIAFIPILYALYYLKKARWAVVLTMVMWTLYPIVWYLDEYAIIGKHTTNITYSVMDVASKVGLVNLLHA